MCCLMSRFSFAFFEALPNPQDRDRDRDRFVLIHFIGPLSLVYLPL